MFTRCVFVIVPVLIGIARGQEIPRDMLPVAYVDKGPTIDGQLNDPCWDKAKEIGDFTSIDEGNAPAKNPTFIRGVYDQQKLYLAFRCVQDQPAALSTQPRDGALWFDDCVELFLSPHVTTTLMQTRSPDEQHFHLIVNSAGQQFDELGSGGPASWDGEWEAKTAVTSDGWQAEIAIPFASLYFENFDSRKNPPEMTLWRAQFGRTTAADGAHSSLFATRGLFKLHGGFGDMVFVSDPADPSLRWKLDEQSIVEPRIAKLQAALAQLDSPQQQRAVKDFLKDFARLKSGDYPAAARMRTLERLDQLERDVLDIQSQTVMNQARQRGDKVAVAAHPPLEDERRVFPDSVPAPADVGKPVVVTLTPGEFESASLVIWNDSPISDLMVRVGSLKDDSNRELPEDAVDVRWVKCWYQAGDSDIVPITRMLVPELLLKDPEMVTVDRVNEKNILLDNYDGDPTARGYRDDAASLQPIGQVEARTSTQAWLTVRVPPDTPAGNYNGIIAITSNEDEIARLPIEIRVLDFTLARSMLENNWYAQTVWGTMDENRALAEMRNLVDHGVDYVGLFELRENLPKVIELMRRAGMATDKVYIQPHRDSSIGLDWTTPQSAAEMARLWKAAAAQAGTEQVYLYLIDEARDAVLAAERPLAEAMRNAGVKTWVACYSNYFDAAGDFIDLANIAHGPVAAELVNKIHAAGKRVFCYANPQGGVERPEIYRRNYGLLLWQADYDGSFDWSWYWQFGPDENPNGWDDFNHRVYRDHMMVYGTKNGVVDTIQWEGWREAVDDTRYLATLLREIDAARQRGQTRSASEADQWVRRLKSGGPAALDDLEGLRRQIIEHIDSCRSGP